MYKSYKDAVLDILSVINYPKDKMDYAEEAEKSVYTDALINLSGKLPDDIKQQIETAKTDFKPFTEEDVEKVRQYISQDDLFNEIAKLSKEDIKEFVKELYSTVNAEQKQKLDAIVKSFEETTIVPQQAPSPTQAAPAPVTPPTTPDAPTQQ